MRTLIALPCQLSLLVVLGCGSSREDPKVQPVQTLTHLARVQALDLDSVARNGTVVFFSKGRELRAEAVLTLVDAMVAHFTPTHGPLALHVAVLTEPDWKAVIDNPYGVPGVRNPGPIAFLPADVEQGVLYRDVLSLAEGLPPAMRRDIDTRCTSLAACTLQFADLIVLHEIAHVYIERSSLGRPNFWLGEFAPDYLVYEYLRGEGGPKLTAWNLMNAVTAHIPPHVASLEEFERRRQEPGAFQSLTPELPRLHGILMSGFRRSTTSSAIAFSRNSWRRSRCSSTPPNA